MKAHIEALDQSQRAYLGALLAATRPGSEPHLTAGDSRLPTARYLAANRDRLMDADLVLVGYSYSDPLPVHCFVQAKTGQRLFDSNRVCKLTDRSYEWPTWLGMTIKGVVLARISVRHLLGDFVLLTALEERKRRRTD